MYIYISNNAASINNGFYISGTSNQIYIFSLLVLLPPLFTAEF